MEPQIIAAIISALVAAATGLFLFWRQGNRRKEQWNRENRLRAEEMKQLAFKKVIDAFEKRIAQLDVFLESETDPNNRQIILGDIQAERRAILEVTGKEMRYFAGYFADYGIKIDMDKAKD